MAFTNINTIADRLVVEMRALGQAVVYLSDTYTAGDLLLRDALGPERALAQAARTVAQVMAEAAVNPVVTEAAIASRGGPATLADFGAGFAALQTSTAAWHDKVLAELRALPAATLVRHDVVERDGAGWRELRFVDVLPEATGLALKNSAELAAFRADLVALEVIDP